MIEEMVAGIENLIAESITDDSEKASFEDYKKVSGATEEELQAFEREFNVLLPDDFKTLYRCKNGSAYPFCLLYTTYAKDCVSPFCLLSLDEIRREKTCFCNKNKLMTECDGFFSDEDIAKLDKRIKPFLFNERWLPFARLAFGSLYLMLDFDPTGEGELGQVIIYVHDPDFIYYVSKGIKELLQDTIDNLEDGYYEEFHCW